MKIGKRQVFYFFLALLSGFVAWYSLGTIPACGHFNMHGFCNDLLNASDTEEIVRLANNCTRLTNVSTSLCGYIFNLGLAALVLGFTTLALSVRGLIHANVKDNWTDEGS